MKKGTKRILWISASVVAVIAIVLVGASFYMLKFSLSPMEGRDDISVIYKQSFRFSPDAQHYADSLKSAGILRDTVITVDGKKRHAMYALHPEAHGRTAVVVHGYKDNAFTFLYLARIYREELAYNVLLPDLYAHGFSDGDAIRMGWKDRLDVLDWCKIASEDFAQGYEPQIVIHGVSMGAATTMSVSGENTPDYIKCFVEDCGYTSVWDEFSKELKEEFGLPPFPLLYSASFLCKILYGWSFKEASPIKAVARCQKPMLLIHGSGDDFVPYSMHAPLVEAKPEPKEVFIAEGSAHARSYTDYPEEYTARVVSFVTMYIR